ncbi:MORN repeat-containing protein 5 [Terramyces sp. JEL0728]|nr:MORN repeat-containing protein 5 [Terramyces sp. JEL0728]
MAEKFTFDDGLVYKKEDWDYCTEKDRRFYQERINGFLPGQRLTNLKLAPVIPITTKDHGYCYYDDSEQQIYNFDGERLRKPDEGEDNWIKSKMYTSRDPGQMVE